MRAVTNKPSDDNYELLLILRVAITWKIFGSAERNEKDEFWWQTDKEGNRVCAPPADGLLSQSEAIYVVY